MGLRKLNYLINSAFINRFKKNPLGVAMFHFGRVGSTVVSELLNQNPNIKWDNELMCTLGSNKCDLFDKDYENDWLKILLNRYSRTKQKVYGFETKAIQQADLGRDALNMNFSVYMDYLSKYGMSKFLILKRKNILKQVF
jgi:hypothetical protein